MNNPVIHCGVDNPMKTIPKWVECDTSDISRCSFVQEFYIILDNIKTV